LHRNGLLRKRTSRQWYDTELGRFLPDRLVIGTCPNPKCGFDGAYSDECDRCGHQHEPTDLINPKSVLTAPPRDAGHGALVPGHVVGVRDAAHLDRGQEEDLAASIIADTLEKVLPPSASRASTRQRYKELKPTPATAQEQIRPGQATGAAVGTTRPTWSGAGSAGGSGDRIGAG
jgi:methionyl-tRNA synthetase